MSLVNSFISCTAPHTASDKKAGMRLGYKCAGSSGLAKQQQLYVTVSVVDSFTSQISLNSQYTCKQCGQDTGSSARCKYTYMYLALLSCIHNIHIVSVYQDLKLITIAKFVQTLRTGYLPPAILQIT